MLQSNLNTFIFFISKLRKIMKCWDILNVISHCFSILINSQFDFDKSSSTEFLNIVTYTFVVHLL